MSKWHVSSLQGKLHVKHGYPFKSEYFSDAGDYIVLTPGNFYEDGGFKRQAGKEKFYIGDIPKNYLHKRGDLIVAMTEQAEGLLGSCAFVPEDNLYLHNQRLGLITTDSKKLDRSYVYYLFQTSSVREQIRLTSSGSKVKHTSPERIYAVTAPLPKVEEQRKIADVLSALDAKIECNNRINAELEAMAKTLYDYWFVQFDFPNANGRPYKSSGGKMVYSPILKREIPAGWSANKLGKVAKTSLGGTPATKNPEYWENADVAWLSSAETAAFPVVDSEQRITQKGIEKSAAVLLPRGSIVISIVRYIRPSILSIDAATNQSVVGILENAKLKKAFLYPLLCGEVPRLMALRTGAQQPHINKGTLDETLVVIPVSEVLETYYKIAEPIFEGIITRAFENQHFMKLRDWLLPMLMNGQVRVV